MAPLTGFPWVWLLAGLLLGTWIGATIGSAAVLLLAGRRMKKLEAVNHLLRVRLRVQTQCSRPPANRRLGPSLQPFSVVRETAKIPISRIASGN